MLIRSLAVAVLGFGMAAALPAPASFAQEETIYACSSQQDLQQTIESNGEIVPDSCRSVYISNLSNDAGELCLIEFGESEGGIVAQIREAAGPQQLWFICDDLATAAGQ